MNSIYTRLKAENSFSVGVIRPVVKFLFILLLSISSTVRADYPEFQYTGPSQSKAVEEEMGRVRIYKIENGKIYRPSERKMFLDIGLAKSYDFSDLKPFYAKNARYYGDTKTIRFENTEHRREVVVKLENGLYYPIEFAQDLLRHVSREKLDSNHFVFPSREMIAKAKAVEDLRIQAEIAEAKRLSQAREAARLAQERLQRLREYDALMAKIQATFAAEEARLESLDQKTLAGQNSAFPSLATSELYSNRTYLILKDWIRRKQGITDPAALEQKISEAIENVNLAEIYVAAFWREVGDKRASLPIQVELRKKFNLPPEEPPRLACVASF